MKARGFVGVGIAAAAAVTLCSSPAFAEDKLIYTTDGGGYAAFTVGDSAFTVCDQKADAMSPHLQVQNRSGQYYYWAVDGVNTCSREVTYAVKGLPFKMRVCQDGGNASRRNLYCSEWTSVQG